MVNNNRHFSFDADERFYQFADVDNQKITRLETFAERFLAKCTLREMVRPLHGAALMEDLIPLLHKLAQGREISGLAAYEQ